MVTSLASTTPGPGSAWLVGGVAAGVGGAAAVAYGLVARFMPLGPKAPGDGA